MMINHVVIIMALVVEMTYKWHAQYNYMTKFET